MKKMLGVAAVILLGAPVVNASIIPQMEVNQLTTKERRAVPHVTTVLAFDRTRCGKVNAKLMPQCNN